VLDPTAGAIEAPVAQSIGRAGRRARGYWAESWERLYSDRIGFACGLLILLFGVLALAAPLLSAVVTHHDPVRQNLANTFALPGQFTFPLGSDELGRDTLTRLIYGARVSLLVAYLTVILALIIGGSVGMLAGYFGGWLDTVLMRVVDMVLSIPSIYLLILLTALAPRIGPVSLNPGNPYSLAVIIALVSWGSLARLVRADVLSVKERDFMLATRSLGASNWRLMSRHLLPNVLAVMVVAASLQVGAIIVTEAALDFIGLGITPPTASWGNMLSNSQVYFYHSLWLVILPGLAIFVTVLAMNVFGNTVRDAFDPRLREMR